MKTSYALFALGLGACNWTTFDDLGDQAWAKSVDAPSLGSTTYGAAMFGTSTGTSGGQISVISDSAPNFSTLELDAKGGATLGKNVKLAAQLINSLSMPPLYASNASGDCAVIGSDGDAAIAYLGCSSTPSSTNFQGQAAKVTSAGYLQHDLVIAAGSLLLISKASGDKCWCNAVDADTINNNPVAALAVGGDGTNLFAWASDGKLYTYTDLSACEMVTVKPPTANCHAQPATIATGMTPDLSSSVHMTGALAVLASSSQVGVVDTKAGAPVGSPLAVSGVSSVAVGTLGSDPKAYVALAFQNRAPGGGVDLYGLTASGALPAAPDQTLADDQPDSGELFGRSVAFVEFNGQGILAVVAKSEVFLYYRTLLYQDTRQK